MELSIESFEISVGKALIKANGDIDIATVELLINAIDKQEKKLIVLDLSGVTFIDSTGVGLIVHKILESRERGMEVKLESIPEPIHNVLEEMGIYEILNELEGR
ncbi:STAS domain-containing protein [Effusibacillus dendaii]|uniref:STAS domain-containing protein n=1 Tax=Effusibacillus dendaii TaxID=2743772 RepID=A0A7I8DAU0_9BACL|nr:STAS domain-containing protein [Effusibacillus dendaii]BCJ85021.1 hypothetical protein skT53_00060 [Effusibacillus dendaii]